MISLTSLTAFLAGFAVALLALLIKAGLMGFRSQRPAQFRTLSPQFDLRKHLSGPIQCEGVVYGPLGHVAARFVARMQGEWDGNTGVLHETFHYDSGRVQQRVWHLRIGNDGAIQAMAPDVIGTGSGRAEGPAVNLRYRIKLDEEAGGHVLSVTDWMYLMENGTIINRSQFTKFGITVAELVATMRPATPQQVRAA